MATSCPFQRIESEVFAFCRDKLITEDVALAIDAAKAAFPALASVELHQAQDSEARSEWVEVRVTCNDDISRFLNQYRECMTQWDRIIPPSSLGLISLTYRIP
jgi:hypothetical protein